MKLPSTRWWASLALALGIFGFVLLLWHTRTPHRELLVYTGLVICGVVFRALNMATGMGSALAVGIGVSLLSGVVHLMFGNEPSAPGWFLTILFTPVAIVLVGVGSVVGGMILKSPKT